MRMGSSTIDSIYLSMMYGLTGRKKMKVPLIALIGTSKEAGLKRISQTTMEIITIRITRKLFLLTKAKMLVTSRF